MQECPFDKGASAMNLLKIEDIHFEVGESSEYINTITDFRTRIKILDERGFSKAGVVIPYPAGSHSVKIKDIEAFIYNLDENGNLTKQKVDKSEIFKEKSKSKNSENSIRFTFPGLKKGSVIEYSYTRVDKDALYLPPWLFQHDMPTRYSQCNIAMPLMLHMKYRLVSSGKVDKDSFPEYQPNSGTLMRWNFAMHDIPAFKAEPFMTSYKDNLERIEFAVRGGAVFLSETNDMQWTMFAYRLLDARYFGGQFYVPVDNTGQFMDSVKRLKLGSDKINAVYRYVKRTISWNGEQDFYPADVEGCWKDKTGSSADMNALLINLLIKAGIQAYPVLVSTRGNGKVDITYPSLGQFDAVDVLAIDDGKPYLLDCTQTSLPFDITPYDILNRNAFLLARGSSKWISVTDTRVLFKTVLDVNAVIDSAGAIKGSGAISYSGISKADKVKEDKKADNENDSRSSLVGDDNGDLKIDSIVKEHADDDYDTLVHKILFHGEISNTGDIYFINPFMFSMLKKNPFTDSARRSDVDFGASQGYETTMRFTLPAAFSVEEIPKTILLTLPDSSIMFSRQISVSNNQLLISNSFTIKKPSFGKDEYSGLKTFFDKVYGLINEQVVLKKKE